MRILISSDMTWSAAAACTGSYAQSPVVSQKDVARAPKNVRPANASRLENLGSRLRDEQRFQVKQGRSFISDASPVAMTAHVAATEGGVSGPYPWRQPV
ncbi:hypothetical protein [Actinomadura sp. HBU206391]|uniref:hypothetical protein n=1 Tax=Actinomadura sp. HBU206391 TaxID=2731692 RepID=UPI00164EE328|nr:hypothetical protein [Actinomadura sp. HBU206391]MBC6462407.1 hypothetical protein [Actinomadura sp. HBU206391]